MIKQLPSGYWEATCEICPWKVSGIKEYVEFQATLHESTTVD